MKLYKFAICQGPDQVVTRASSTDEHQTISDARHGRPTARILRCSSGSFIPVYVDFNTNSIKTKGMTLCRLETVPFKVLETTEVTPEILKFLPLVDPPTQVRSGLTLKYVGINLKDMTIDKTTEREVALRSIDYVGTDSRNKRIFGLAHCNEKDSSVEYDPILRWDAPENWSDEDLSTIPFHYSLAYYLLLEVQPFDLKGRLILILGGNSAIGHAAICVAIELGAVVLTTVECRDQAPALLKHFPQIEESHIFLLDGMLAFNVKRQTMGRNLFVTINPYSGESLPMSLDLLTYGGACIQLGSAEMRRKSKLGMGAFVFGAALYGFPDVNFSSYCSDEKRKIRDLISRALRNGALKPLPRTFYSWMEREAAMESLSTINQGGKVVLSLADHGGSMNTLLQMGKTYLVPASNDSNWLQLLTWLTKRSVSRIIVALSGHMINKAHQHQLKNLMKQCISVSFLLLPDSDFDSIQGTRKMFESVCELGPLEVILCLALDQRKLSNIDTVSRDKAYSVSYFISLFSEGKELCHNRTLNGLPSINVESKSYENSLKSVLPHLDNILDRFARQNNSISSMSKSVNKAERQPRKSVNFKSLLPASAQDLVDLSNELTVTAEFREVTTKGCRFKYVKECEPVFVIPGYSSKSLKNVFKGLMYPAFCATPVLCSQTAEATAFDLFQSLKLIRPNGSYTIVGETWSSCVALELGLLLENDGNTVKLILINGSPESTKSFLTECKQNFQSLSHNQDVSTQLLGLEKVNKNDLTTQIISNSSNSFSGEDKERIKSGLLSVQTKLMMAQTYEMKPQVFKGEVVIVKQQQSPSEVCPELLQCVNENQELYFSSETSYEKLVNGPEIVNAINANAVIKMM